LPKFFLKSTEFYEVELTLCKPKPKCPRPCTTEYNPVCGFNGLVYKQFGNPCQFQVHNECEVKDGKIFEKVELSLCKPKCPRACTLEYNPVCGFNGVVYKEFGNACALTAYNECDAKDGESKGNIGICQTNNILIINFFLEYVKTKLELCQQTEECPKVCTKEYNPVCGYNGEIYKKFGNRCMFNAYNTCDVKNGKS
jgi:Kazal-type serine protease inhibitor domain